MKCDFKHDNKVETHKENRYVCLSMQQRLFIYLLFLNLFILSGVLIILIITGFFRSEKNHLKAVLESEINHISNNIYNDFSNISMHGIELSKSLSISLENSMTTLDINVHNYLDDTVHIEKLLSEQFNILSSRLQETRASGIFLILNADINKNAEFSNYGMYIRDVNTNIIDSKYKNLQLLYGPKKIAIKNKIDISTQWKSEIDSKYIPISYDIIENTAKYKLDLSKSFYWKKATPLNNEDPEIILCIVPLISKDNTVFGICGFELNSILFKDTYLSSNTYYTDIISIFSKIDGNTLDLSSALIGDNVDQDSMKFTKSNLVITNNKNRLNIYKETSEKNCYLGLHKEVSLYSSDSIYKDDKYAISVVMPEKSFRVMFLNRHMAFIQYFGILLIISIIIIYYISKKQVQPLKNTLGLLKTVDPINVPKCNITEINDLIEFLAKHDGNEKQTKIINTNKENIETNTSLFNDFLNNIETLSMAEKAVFNLYLKDHTAKEIANILCLSINTIKTHNKRIYMKLNVSSRKELMVYIKMMEEKGLIEEIKTNQ